LKECHVTTTWIAIDKNFDPRELGFLPEIIMEEDERPVRDGFRLDRTTMTLHYPGDPPLKPAAFTQIGDETVVFYPVCSFLMILQKDGEFAVTRVD
jgi:hypothetical protein